MRYKRRLNKALLMAGMPILVAACLHEVRFEGINYSVEQKPFDASLIAVIAPDTLAQRKTINSYMGGGAVHTWEAHPGEMLKQIAEVEFPQIFSYYRTAAAYEEPKEGSKRLIVDLSVQHYDFSDFHTTVVVKAKAYGPGHAPLWEKSYWEEGDTQGAKIFWGHEFAMKSAIRQSSFDAYKKAFARLRTDLATSIQKVNPPTQKTTRSQPVERKKAGPKSGPCQTVDGGLICRAESDYSLH